MRFVTGFASVMVLSVVVVCVTGFSGCVYLFIPSWGVTVVGWGWFVVCGLWGDVLVFGLGCGLWFVV